MSSGFKSLRRFNALFRARYALSPTWPSAAVTRSDTWFTAGFLPSGQRSRTAPELIARRLAWQDLLEHSSSRRAVPGVEAVLDSQNSYARTVSLGGHSGWVRVQPSENGPWLDVTLPASLAEISWPILTRLRAEFDLDANPAPIDALLRADPLLSPSVRKHPGLRVPGAWDAFELAVRAVLGQQISVAGATTLAGRLAARFGLPIETPLPALHRLAPTAHDLASTEEPEIAAIGLPRARAATLRALAQAALRGELTFTPGTRMEAVVTALRRIPGIGEWTAHISAMRALRHPDAFSGGRFGSSSAAPLAIPGSPLPSEKQALARSEGRRPEGPATPPPGPSVVVGSTTLALTIPHEKHLLHTLRFTTGAADALRHGRRIGGPFYGKASPWPHGSRPARLAAR